MKKNKTSKTIEESANRSDLIAIFLKLSVEELIKGMQNLTPSEQAGVWFTLMKCSEHKK